MIKIQQTLRKQQNLLKKLITFKSFILQKQQKIFFIMNKQKKLKLILSSLKQKQLIKFFQSFLDTIKCKFYKSIKQISFSCYQSTCQVDNYMVNGYGKTSSEALISGINNILDCLIQEEQYCQVMRQCLKKFNISPYGLTNNGSTSKKQLLSTQKTVKTLGPQTSMSLQKKVLTMSANLSSNSKNSSSKPKSIKDEIFEYFNLENLKVKNPNQPFNIVTPMAGNNKIQKIQNVEIVSLCKSKQKYHANEQGHNSGSNLVQKQLQQIYKRIRQVKQQISGSQKQNFQLKQQLQSKKKASTKINQAQTNQYFTRPSLQGKQQKKIIPTLNTQSNKKLSYLEMSLNDKLLLKQQKQNIKSIKPEIANENHFEKVQIPNNYKVSAKIVNENQCLGQSTASQKNNVNKGSEQRKCLVDISNIKTEASQMHQSSKPSQYATFNGRISTSKASQSKQSTSAFQTAINYQNNERVSSNQILYSKGNQQQQQCVSIIESSKKLRSFSVQNSINEKLLSGNGVCNNINNYMCGSIKNPMSILSGNMNNSFDNSVNNMNMGQKKIKIPRLNLQILPNYHGRSNKSLNQSLMQNYQKKNINIIGNNNQ